MIVRRHRVLVVRLPAALILALGYAWTAVVLATRWSVPVGEALDRIAWEFSVVCAAFAVWHTLGYLGYINDGPRKVGYLASGAFLAGLATVLFHDQIVLAGGYVAIGTVIALVSYWRYPRRSET